MLLLLLLIGVGLLSSVLSINNLNIAYARKKGDLSAISSQKLKNKYIFRFFIVYSIIYLIYLNYDIICVGDEDINQIEIILNPIFLIIVFVTISFFHLVIRTYKWNSPIYITSIIILYVSYFAFVMLRENSYWLIGYIAGSIAAGSSYLLRMFVDDITTSLDLSDSSIAKGRYYFRGYSRKSELKSQIAVFVIAIAFITLIFFVDDISDSIRALYGHLHMKLWNSWVC